MPLISIQINADSFVELDYALDILRTQLSSGGTLRAKTPVVGDTSATVEIEAAPAKTKATKSKAEKAPEPEVQTAPAPDPAPEAPAANTALAPMGEKSPAEMRDEGIRTLQDYFTKNSNGMGAINTLQQKYGVTMFSQIADAQAAAFLADAKLVAAGSYA
jgi:predicted flap endonuclease-1-like 5' DNA nuclease